MTCFLLIFEGLQCRNETPIFRSPPRVSLLFYFPFMSFRFRKYAVGGSNMAANEAVIRDQVISVRMRSDVVEMT